MSWENDALERIRKFTRAGPESASEEAGGSVRDALSRDRKIGRYRLLDILGEGGMGIVFRAYDELLGRDVAFKMLKTVETFSSRQIERFEREVRNAASLRHPCIVTVYDFGKEGDVLYYTMERVSGRPLTRGAGDLEQHVRVLEKVSRAVQYAHEQGVIHRDLKPANILVDAQGEPHLLDFGLSRNLAAQAGVTRAGAFFGTPEYASPEQAQGRVQEVDERSDVYALGAILYEALSGHAPFHAAMTAETMRRLATEEPEPPPGPPALAAICMKALERDRTRRYPTAAAFADDLKRYLSKEPIQAKVPSLTARFIRHCSLAVLAAAALLVAAAVGVWALRPKPALPLADDASPAPRPEPVSTPADDETFFCDFSGGALGAGWSARGVSDQNLSGAHLVLEHDYGSIESRSLRAAEAVYTVWDYTGDLTVEVRFDDFAPRENCRFQVALSGVGGPTAVLGRQSQPPRQTLQFGEGGAAGHREVDYARNEGTLKLEFRASRGELRAYYQAAAGGAFQEVTGGPLVVPGLKGPYLVALSGDNWIPGGPSHVRVDWIKITKTASR